MTGATTVPAHVPLKRSLHDNANNRRKNRNYNIKLDKSEVVFDTIITSYILEFDNRPYQEYMEKITLRNDTSLPIRAAAIFDMFPFSILFNVRLL